MQQEDVEAVHAVSKECFTVPWSLEALENEVHNSVANYQVAEVDGKIIGYGGLWCVLDEGEITNIAVSKEYREQGVGKAILNALIQVALQKNLVMIHLEVRSGNIVAQNLYKCLGFKKIAIRKDYYQKPIEDAVIMQYQL